MSNGIIPCSFPSNIRVINGITYTNHNRTYSLVSIIRKYTFNLQFQVVGNRIMQIIRTSFYKKLYSNYFAFPSHIAHKRCIETKDSLLMAFFRRTVWLNK